MNAAGSTSTRTVAFDLDDTLYPQRAFERSGFCAVAAWPAPGGHADESRVIAVLANLPRCTGPSGPNLFDCRVGHLDPGDVRTADLPSLIAAPAETTGRSAAPPPGPR